MELPAEFYAPVKGRDFVEMCEGSMRLLGYGNGTDFTPYSERWKLYNTTEGWETRQQAVLPPGVHYLSEESCVILERAHWRGQAIADRHIKRVS
jgi:hypothetical protein